MKRSYLSKVVGAGVVAASFAILPLASPASAGSPGMTETGTLTATMQGYNNNMTNGSGMDSRWMSSMEFYQMGRHEWIGNGMMSSLRTTGDMMQNQTMESQPMTVPTTPSQPMDTPSTNPQTTPGSGTSTPRTNP
jgi:hypothetical protein